MPSFLVTGATGQQGGATAHELLTRNATVHALVRSPSSLAAQELQNLGCVLFPGDWDDVPAIEAAVQGVQGVFLNTMPNYADPEAELRQANNIIDAALKAGSVETMVVTTAFYTGRSDLWARKEPEHVLGWYYSRKAEIEDAVRKAGFRHYTVLRPAWLMHNYLPPTSPYHFPEMEAEQTLATAYKPSTVMPQFDAYDVGRFAAAALLEPARFDKEEIELGNEHLTIEQVADLLTKASGVEVKTRYRGAEEIQAMAGKVVTQPFQLAANEHGFILDSEGLKNYDIPLTTLAQYFKRNREELLKALGAAS